MIVIDASLAVKWFLVEADSSDANRFLADFAGQIAVPDLIVIEVASALVRRANSIKTEASDIVVLLDKWSALLTQPAIKLYRGTPRGTREAARLAIEMGHPLKDCIYLALARELDSDFVTCDMRFAARAMLMYPRTRTLETPTW
jgi:predicted nucleic acid-binding protein